MGASVAFGPGRASVPTSALLELQATQPVPIQVYSLTLRFAARLATVDVGGQVLFMFGFGLLVLAFTWAGGEYSWASAAVLVPLCAGLLASQPTRLNELQKLAEKGKQLSKDDKHPEENWYKVYALVMGADWLQVGSRKMICWG